MRILLHICCGPCAIMPLRVLAEEGHEAEGYFFNPNIQPRPEYMKRRAGALQAARLCLAEAMAEPMAEPVAEVVTGSVARIAPYPGIPIHFPPRGREYAARSWRRAALAQKDGAPYGRCGYCWSSRMENTARFAKEHGFAAFTTSLLYSRHQRHEGIAAACETASRAAGLPFFRRDFRPYWREGIEASKKLGLYRQRYCGCMFSKTELSR